MLNLIENQLNKLTINSNNLKIELNNGISNKNKLNFELNNLSNNIEIFENQNYLFC